NRKEIIDAATVHRICWNGLTVEKAVAILVETENEVGDARRGCARLWGLASGRFGSAECEDAKDGNAKCTR
ncbi:MAG TPA: hypothetical protein VGZ26_07805, partial [Pirellulales bacterium]|nr:hypothetical protein [Pirellulales bacterium]